MDSVRHVLVLPDRDAAEEVAEAVGQRFTADGHHPRIVRDALAGDDDAEDAQWLVVVEDPGGDLGTSALDALAAEYEGWLEEEYPRRSVRRLGQFCNGRGTPSESAAPDRAEGG